MKSGKLAKRKKNYNLVQVCCCWCGAQDACVKVRRLKECTVSVGSRRKVGGRPPA